MGPHCPSRRLLPDAESAGARHHFVNPARQRQSHEEKSCHRLRHRNSHCTRRAGRDGHGKPAALDGGRGCARRRYWRGVEPKPREAEPEVSPRGGIGRKRCPQRHRSTVPQEPPELGPEAAHDRRRGAPGPARRPLGHARVPHPSSNRRAVPPRCVRVVAAPPRTAHHRPRRPPLLAMPRHRCPRAWHLRHAGSHRDGLLSIE